jgi:hypothetical protein
MSENLEVGSIIDILDEIRTEMDLSINGTPKLIADVQEIDRQIKALNEEKARLVEILDQAKRINVEGDIYGKDLSVTITYASASGELTNEQIALAIKKGFRYDKKNGILYLIAKDNDPLRLTNRIKKKWDAWKAAVAQLKKGEMKKTQKRYTF